MARVYLLHLNEAAAGTRPATWVNSVSGGPTFLNKGNLGDTGAVSEVSASVPFGAGAFTQSGGSNRTTITSATQVTFTGDFTMQGFTGSPLEGNAFIAQFSTNGTDGGAMRIQLLAINEGGGSFSFLCFAQQVANSGFFAFQTAAIAPASVAGVTGYHWALQREGDYLTFRCNGSLRATATTPLTGSLTGYIDPFGAYEQATGGCGGEAQIRISELAGDDTAVYTGSTYTVPTARFADPGGGGVTVALTGAEAAAQAGTVTQSRTRALTGSGLTASVGTVTQSRTAALTGGGLTAQVGTVTPSVASDVTVALSGTEATAQAGDSIETLDTMLTGAEGTAGLGTVSPDVSVVLVGHGLAAAPGDLARSIDVGLAGAAATSSAGDTLPNLSAGVTGVEAAAAVGNASAGSDVIVELTGQGVAVATGAVVPSAATALSGQAVTAAAGLAVPGITAGLAGTQIATEPGAVSAGSDVTVQLTGQDMSAAAGALVPGTDRLLTGAEAVAAFGALGSDVVVGLVGSGVVATAGSLSAETPPTGWLFGTIDAESRLAIVGAETRSATIGAESRTWSMTR